MTQEIVQATTFFDRRFNVTSRDLDRVLSQALAKKADYADLYFEYRVTESIGLEESMVKNASRSLANGVGVRVLAEAKTGYAFTDDITIDNLQLAARTAQYIAQDRGSSTPVPVGKGTPQPHDLYTVAETVTDVPLEKKIGLLYEMDRIARDLDPRVKIEDFHIELAE